MKGRMKRNQVEETRRIEGQDRREEKGENKKMKMGEMKIRRRRWRKGEREENK